MSWSMKFDDLIALPDGRRLKTLAEAMAWLAKEKPRPVLYTAGNRQGGLTPSTPVDSPSDAAADSAVL